MTKRSMTIKDVAVSAKVSVATVSNVLNGKNTLYSPETADVVWAAVKHLEYRPNQVARNLKQGDTKTLGVVVDRAHGRLTRNTYINALLDGFLEFATDAGYQIKLFSLLAACPEVVLGQLEDGSVDGLVLFAPPSDSPLITWAETTRMPLVFAGSAPPMQRFAAVDIDDRGAARMAVRWLIEQGHTRIGWISGPVTQWSAQRREEGYREAMAAAGLAVHPGWRYVDNTQREPGIADGVATIMDADPCLTAILCWNDGYALGVMHELQRRGLRIPEDVSVVGFDDSEPAHWVRPGLTTVRQPLSEMGRKAAESLIRQILTGIVERGHTLYQGELVVRASVAGPRENAVAA